MPNMRACHFDSEADAILDRPAIVVSQKPRVRLGELVQQIAVRSLNFDAIWAGVDRRAALRSRPPFQRSRRAEALGVQ